MAQPTAYNPTTDFSDYQLNNAGAPFNGANHDTEFNNIATTLGETLTNLALIQRDDGLLANLSVHIDALSSAVRALLLTGVDFQGAWVTATAYTVGQSVVESSKIYICIVAHTSGTFATDLAASKWILLLGDNLADLDSLANTDGNFIVGDGSNFVAESGVTARNSLGFGKGADVASAAALPVDIEGSVFDVTGTTQVTSINSKGVGTTIYLQFDSSLIMTHHATDLVLPDGENITVRAGDIMILNEYASGDWRCLLYFPYRTQVQYVQFEVTAPTVDNATGDGQYYFYVPDKLNGLNLVSVVGFVISAGTTNTMNIQIRNVTQGADILSTVLTIDSTETSSLTAATPAVIDTAEDDVTTYDQLRVDIDAIHTTPAKGLTLLLGFA